MLRLSLVFTTDVVLDSFHEKLFRLTYQENEVCGHLPTGLAMEKFWRGERAGSARLGASADERRRVHRCGLSAFVFAIVDWQILECGSSANSGHNMVLLEGCIICANIVLLEGC